MRIVKHLGARSTPADEATPLILIPCFPGETIKNLSISAYCASGDASAIDQPGQMGWAGLTIPWSILWASQMLDAGAAPNSFSAVSSFDQLFERFLLSVDESGTEYYGGDVDADPETTTGEEGHAAEELIDSGPIGVHQFLDRQVVMQPLAAEGNTTIRFGDFFNMDTGPVPGAKMGGLLMLGAVRYEHASELNFNVELDDATSIEMMGLLISGDYTKVKAKIEGDTSALGDYLRTVLFGGDNYIEADTLKGPAAKSVMMVKAVIDSPIRRSH